MSKKIENEHGLEEVSEDKNQIFTWIKAHKKQLTLIGISIPTLIAILLGLKNKDAIKELFDNLKEQIEKANLYSNKWFENATDAELDTAREKVRLDYCSSGDDFRAACSLQNLLTRFDREMTKRAWGNETPHAPSIHREHGWYLSNDD